MHRLLKLLATQPQLLLDHAQAYAVLASEELALARAAWHRQAMLQAAGLLALSSAVILAGVALILWAVTPVGQIHALWVLWVTPVVPLAAALACLSLAHQSPGVVTFSNLRSQLKADMALLSSAPSA